MALQSTDRVSFGDCALEWQKAVLSILQSPLSESFLKSFMLNHIHGFLLSLGLKCASMEAVTLNGTSESAVNSKYTTYQSGTTSELPAKLAQKCLLIHALKCSLSHDDRPTASPPKGQNFDIERTFEFLDLTVEKHSPADPLQAVRLQ